MLDGIVEYLKTVLLWTVDQLTALVRLILGIFYDAVLAILPDGWEPDFSILADYISLANYYIPLNYGLFLFTTWLSIRMIALVVRHLIKAIPTIG